MPSRIPENWRQSWYLVIRCNLLSTSPRWRENHSDSIWFENYESSKFVNIPFTQVPRSSAQFSRIAPWALVKKGSSIKHVAFSTPAGPYLLNGSPTVMCSMKNYGRGKIHKYINSVSNLSWLNKMDSEQRHIWSSFQSNPII